jgi:hypothetical protein
MKEWQRHESYIEKEYKGEKTKGSGSGVKEKGDVRVASQAELVECKYLTPQYTPSHVKHLEKVAEEAYTEGLDPAVAMRYYLPDSVLADRDGYVDVVMRLVRDDVRRGHHA